MTSAEAGPGRPPLDPRARLLLPVLFVSLVALTVYHYSRAPSRDVSVLRGAAMGTTWTLKLPGPALSPEREDTLRQLVASRLDRVDGLMSTWRPDSQLSRFNAHGSSEPFPIEPEFREVLRIARAVSELSGGALDVTVDPLVGLWGFGASARDATPAPPSEQELQRVRERVGYAKLQIDAQGRLRKRIPGLRLDVSAVAKGYAVDLIAEALLQAGQSAFLFELGGELRGHGTHVDGATWRVAIESPRSQGRGVHRVALLRDAAMATSGDYRNYYERAGRRVSHTIDPRSGRPIEHALASVTVIHAEAAWADALATALNVLGPEQGLALARAEGLAAYFITRAGGGFQVSLTDAFRGFLAADPPAPP